MNVDASRGTNTALHCPSCGYQLTALLVNRCPECGKAFDPVELARPKRLAWWIPTLIITFVMYAPYSWLLFIDYPWNEYRWSWIKLWPGLPFMFPLHALGRQVLGIEMDDVPGVLSTYALSIAILIGLIVLARRARATLIVLATVVGLVSALNAWALYHAFLM